MMYCQACGDEYQDGAVQNLAVICSQCFDDLDQDDYERLILDNALQVYCFRCGDWDIPTTGHKCLKHDPDPTPEDALENDLTDQYLDEMC